MVSLLIHLNTIGNRRIGTISFLFTLLLAGCSAIADFTVEFDQPEYSIHPGDTFAVQVRIDPVPAVGLFSMGVKVIFPGAKAQVTGENAIVVPDALNANGLGIPPAEKSWGNGYAAAAGAVVVFEPYYDSLLLTVYIDDVTLPDNPIHTYPLHLEFYYSEPQANFLDFDGSILDPEIIFNSAVVKVTVPADFNGDQRVDLVDFSRLAAHWGENNCGGCVGTDLSGDEKVGLPDLLIFLQYWLEASSF